MYDEDDEIQNYLRNVESERKDLSRQQQKALAERISEDSQDALDTLASAYLATAAEMAVAVYDKEGWRGMTLQELIHQANTGLLLATRRYATRSQHDFADYIKPYIEAYLNAVVDDYRMHDNYSKRKVL